MKRQGLIALTKNQKRERRRKEIKKSVHKIKEQNGCSICGYNRCNTALIFHHVNKATKEHIVSRISTWTALTREMGKCILVCANCHAELHSRDQQENSSQVKIEPSDRAQTVFEFIN